MNNEDFIEYFKLKERPLDKLQKELFESLPEYKYYNLGASVVLSSLYKTIKDYKLNFTKKELLEIIKIMADENKDIHYYFYNLIEKES